MQELSNKLLAFSAAAAVLDPLRTSSRFRATRTETQTHWASHPQGAVHKFKVVHKFVKFNVPNCCPRGLRCLGSAGLVRVSYF